ncbi:M48 family metalloprotease [Allosphingosinicella indica]|uniref:Putative Zn-dependent protease, contains TPR repeats n=1 Tax=Allosphingosinicella indica TaxID=941907 RepID=A0A1X7GGI8_9SPHN|nr:M48 family metalloprotease [Allosphingosinicella indica]SMF69303.1 Putative Zn-dependent protease, contains TPR repeats [Allosphingosinicella indica]
MFFSRRAVSETDRRGPGWFARLLAIVTLSFAVAAQPALAQQQILRDSETEAMLNEISRPLIEAAGLRPEDVRIVLIGDPSLNAFVAGGQIVYINSGTITRADNANEVQGVIAHELGHITGGHIARMGQGMQQATSIAILSLILAAAAMAAGAGEAATGVMAAGQQAAMGKFLAFTRTQESSADQAGAKYLSAAGESGRGSISFFKRIQNEEFRLAIPQTDSYNRTHPLTGERLQALENLYKNDPAWDKPTDPALEARFQRVRAKLAGYIDDPQRTMTQFPESDTSVPARYARAYAWHKRAYPDKAGAEIDALLANAPHDPYFLELKGQILLEGGKPREAIPPLREAVQRSGNAPMIGALLGHALIATEDEANFAEAKRVLRLAVDRDNDNPFAWYQLGIVYDREGDQARAALATAERYNLTGQPRLAMSSAEMAMRGIPQGTPDWIRAQDIAMVSKTATEKKRR